MILCQDDEMYAIDEYFDEVESTPGINFSNVCLEFDTHIDSVLEKYGACYY